MDPNLPEPLTEASPILHPETLARRTLAFGAEVGLPQPAPNTLTFRADGHVYQIDGREIPSVTTILKAWSTIAQLPPEILEPAARRGTLVHEATELEDQGDLNPQWAEAEGITGYVDAWRRFKRDVGFMTEFSEFRVYHEQLGYCGTFDAFGTYVPYRTRARLLLDKKSGDPDPVHPLQVAAYAKAARLSPNVHLATLYLRPDGYYSFLRHSSPEDWLNFLACLRAYRWRQQHGIA